MLRDLANNVSAQVAIASATYAASTTPAAIDLADARSACVLIHVGAGGITFSGTNRVDFVLTHSDDNSTYANVAVTDVVGPASVTSGIVKSLIAAHASADVTKVGYIGGKRYLKLLAQFGGTHGTGTPIGCEVVTAGFRQYPAA